MDNRVYLRQNGTRQSSYIYRSPDDLFLGNVQEQMFSSVTETMVMTIPTTGWYQLDFVHGLHFDTWVNGILINQNISNNALESTLTNVSMNNNGVEQHIGNAILRNITFSTTSTSSASRTWDVYAPDGTNSADASISVKLNTPTITSITPGIGNLRVYYNSVSGATSYNIYRNGSYIGNTSSTSYYNTGLSRNTSYYYQVIAAASGLTNSNISSTYSKYTNVATPTINVLNDAVDQTKNTITVGQNGNPSNTLYNVYYSKDGGSWNSLNGWVNTSNLTKTHTGLSADSTYRYKAVARNLVNVVTSDSSIKTVKINGSPLITITSPATDDYRSEVSGYDTFTLSGTVTDSDNNTVTIDGTINGVKKETVVNATTDTPWSLSWNVLSDSIPESTITAVSINGNDKTGKNNATSTTTWSKTLYVDKTKPLAPTIDTNTDWTNAESVPVTITDILDTGTYQSGPKNAEYKLSGATTLDWTTYSGEFNIINAGETTIEARTVDQAGNIGIDIDSKVVKIDRNIPTGTGFDIDATYGDAIYTRDKTVNIININAADTGGSGDEQDASIPKFMEISNVSDFSVSSGWVSYTDRYENWALSDNDGIKTVYVRFKDSVDNIGVGISDTIIYDSTRPIIYVSTPSSYAVKNGGTVSYELIIDDINTTKYGINKNDKSKVILSGVGTIADSISELENLITIEDIDLSHRKININLPVDLTKEGIINIKVLEDALIDAAGNKSVETLGNFSLVVDSTAPTNQNILFEENDNVTGGKIIKLLKTSVDCDGGEDGDSIRFAPIGYLGIEPANGLTITSTHGRSEDINAPLEDGEYRLYIIDAAGNISEASDAVLSVKTLGPTVTVEGPSDSYAQASGSAEYIVTYSLDTETITLGQYDIGLVRTGTANAYVNIEEVDGEPLKRRVVLDNLMGEGTVAIKISAETASDSVGNMSSGSLISNVVFVDNTAPIMNIISISSDNENDSKKATVGDRVKILFETDESVDSIPTVFIGGRKAVVSSENDGKTSWKAEYLIPNTTSIIEGTLSIKIENIIDKTGNITATVTSISDVVLDTIPPSMIINGEMDNTNSYYISAPKITFAEGSLTLENITSGVTTNPATGENVNIGGEYIATLSDMTGNTSIETFAVSKDSIDVSTDKINIKIGYEIGDHQEYVTRQITLPTNGVEGSTITWTIKSGTAIDNAGNVSRPNGENKVVTLEAMVEKNGVSSAREFNLTVIALSGGSLPEQVEEDKVVLLINYAEGDNINSVTKNLELSKVGAINSSDISWSSSDINTISIGEIILDNFNTSVTRPNFGEGDKEVTLIATITKETESQTKEFVITVKEKEGVDAEMIALDKTKISIIYSGEDSINAVRNNVSFMYTGSEGTSVTWSSNDTNIISIDDVTGIVVRPKLGEEDKGVKITATLMRAGLTETVEYNLTVKEETEANNLELMELDLAAIDIGYRFSDNAESIKTHVILPTIGENGSAIIWSSNNLAISNNGTVTRGENDVNIILTAVVSNGDESGTKTFALTVKEKELDLLHQLGSDALAVEIIYGQGEDSTLVKSNIELAVVGANGSIISWSSSHENIVSDVGVVTTSTTPINVTLMAAISIEGYIIYREFLVKVSDF